MQDSLRDFDSSDLQEIELALSASCNELVQDVLQKKSNRVPVDRLLVVLESRLMVRGGFLPTEFPSLTEFVNTLKAKLFKIFQVSNETIPQGERESIKRIISDHIEMIRAALVSEWQAEIAKVPIRDILINCWEQERKKTIFTTNSTFPIVYAGLTLSMTSKLNTFKNDVLTSLKNKLAESLDLAVDKMVNRAAELGMDHVQSVVAIIRVSGIPYYLPQSDPRILQLAWIHRVLQTVFTRDAAICH